MLPRKKVKLNPKAESGAELESSPAPRPQEPEVKAQQSPQPSSEQAVRIGKLDGLVPTNSNNESASTRQTSKTWYGGTWPRRSKANPVTQVARESISAIGGAASEAVTLARPSTIQLPTIPVKIPAIHLSRAMASSSRSLPSGATNTKLNITSNATTPANGAAKEDEVPESEEGLEPEPMSQIGGKPASGGEKGESGRLQEQPFLKDRADAESKNKPPVRAKATNDSASWLNWFSRAEDAKPGSINELQDGINNEQTGKAAKDHPQGTIVKTPQDTPSLPIQRRNSDPNPVSPKLQEKPPSRSWLGLWSNATTQITDSPSVSATGVAINISTDSSHLQTRTQLLSGAKSDPMSNLGPPASPAETGKPYGWAFWSRDQAKNNNRKPSSGASVGELALARSPAQAKPENSEMRGVPQNLSKRQRPQSLEESPKQSSAITEAEKGIATEPVAVASKAKPTADTDSKAKRMPENLLLPPLKCTYQPAGRPGLIEQISRLLHLGSQSDLKHVNLIQTPPRVKRALAIGIHGYFPAPLIRSVLGQPTGTSIRFANNAASAIQRWSQNQGYSCEIEKVALEGEGKIAERIDLLWKLMLNWIDKIQKADFVMIACHSQGVPVATMLVAKLLALGCVNSAKIGVCAMAGVNLGPFADYKSRWISGSAGELFEFARPDSQVSRDYKAALDVALRSGVKIVYVGSIDDQLVSLNSSTFGAVSHPCIYRAVFVDGKVHAPDFLTHLVGFALKLRNLGIPDHGLIRELSAPLAGSLYSGEGHSRIYDDEAVYYLAVEHALETTSIGEMAVQFNHDNPVAAQNPFILPFAMRGVLEEDYVRAELYDEIMDLIKEFNDWKPSSKVLKDVKFRLEGVRLKL